MRCLGVLLQDRRLPVQYCTLPKLPWYGACLMPDQLQSPVEAVCRQPLCKHLTDLGRKARQGSGCGCPGFHCQAS